MQAAQSAPQNCAATPMAAPVAVNRNADASIADPQHADAGPDAMAAIMNAAPADAAANTGPIHILHIYTDQGESKLDELTLASGVFFKNIPTSGASFVQYAADQLLDWHNAPARQFVVGVAGESEYEVAGGVKHVFKPGDLLFVEDLQGRGHISRAKSQFTHMFVRVPDSFDVVSWARGGP
jgi:hypothetical protein